jgi:hypothetical protein
MMRVNWDVLPFGREDLERYLSSLVSGEVCVSSVRELRGEGEEDKLKGFGYGVPLLIECVCDGKDERFVFHTVSRDGFGHERRSDRASNLLLDHATFNDLPRHVRSRDVGALGMGGGLISLGETGEFFHLTDYAEGKPYAADLHRISRAGELAAGDEDRALALADYLADIHAVKHSDALLYRRRIRDLIGHGEGIMGMLDSYPSDFALAPPTRLEAIESECLAWRWRIKDAVHRLSQVHGDFHPWNVLFREGTDFGLLDRSRGAWGEPADDVSAMSINYVFFSLQCYGELAGPYERLYDLFWDRYLDRTGDGQLLTVIQPFYAWRALVVASPVWYPNLDASVREALFYFIESVLDTERFDPGYVSDYLP